MSVKLNRNVDRFAKLGIYDFNGNNLEKWKANVLNKGLGVIMIIRIMDNFNIEINDIKEKQKSLLDEELKLQNQLIH